MPSAIARSDTRKLPCKVVIGNTHFHKGVSMQTALDRLERAFEYAKEPPITEEQRQAARELFGAHRDNWDKHRPTCPHCGAESWLHDESASTDRTISKSDG